MADRKTRFVRISIAVGFHSDRCGNTSSRRVTTPAANSTGTYVLMTRDAPCHCSQANSKKTTVITTG